MVAEIAERSIDRRIATKLDRLRPGVVPGASVGSVGSVGRHHRLQQLVVRN